jgi:hypothetical protein
VASGVVSSPRTAMGMADRCVMDNLAISAFGATTRRWFELAVHTFWATLAMPHLRRLSRFCAFEKPK